jgi:ABC-2 type transport system ATP-binding protein
MSGNRRTATRRAVGLLLATVLLGACSSGEGDEAASADSGAASTTAVASGPDMRARRHDR